jgi:molybdopterin molybdotransferase
MIGLAEAQARLLSLKRPVDTELCDLAGAAGRWAAEPVIARRTQPAYDISAMDGYAIRYADMPGPWRITGESAAGLPFDGKLFPGEAVRIFTGAALPAGSDTIVIQEDVVRVAVHLALTADGPLAQGSAVRRAGEDFKRNAVLIDTGAAFTPARIALAALGGHDTMSTRRLIRVAIASTGNELVPRPSEFEGGLPDSNGPMLSALVRDLPVSVAHLGSVHDDPVAVAQIMKAAGDFDILVTTGGVSVGDHDLVQPALTAAGAEIAFWKVAIRPGKPVIAARLGDAVILGLPGNPVSAFVTAQLFLRPLIAHLSGATDPMPRRIVAKLGAPLPAVGHREDFVRARWHDGQLIPVRAGDSGALFPLAEAQALVVRPAGSVAAATGDCAEVILLA